MGFASLLQRKDTSGDKNDTIRFSLILPANGKVIVTPRGSTDSDINGQGPDTITFHGEAETCLPPGMGTRVFRDLRMVMRAFSTIDMGPERGIETDVFWEHTVYANLPDDHRKLGEGAGSNKIFITFQYCLVLPASDVFLACPRVEWVLFAQLIGLKLSLEASNLPRHLSMAAMEKDDHFKPFPVLEESAAPLERTITTRTSVEFIHNPGVDQQSNVLDDYSASHSHELGLVETSCASEDFTIAGPFTSHIKIMTPSTRISIHGIRLSILQRETCTSPRDGEIRMSETIVRFEEHGDCSASSSPLWTSKGPDDATWSVDLSGRFPHSSQIRQSTLPGISTPVTVEHFLVYDVFFSIAGQDSSGNAIEGRAGIRRFRKRRRVVMPHCALSSRKVGLPTYGKDSAHTLLSAYRDEWCGTCRRNASQVICTICEGRAIPHTKAKSGDSPNDPCPTCADKRLQPKPATDHYLKGQCACTQWCTVYTRPESEDVRETRDSADEESSSDSRLASKLQDEWQSTISTEKSGRRPK